MVVRATPTENAAAVTAAVLEFFRDRFPEPRERRFLLACSGGPDSVALARALKDVEDACRIRIEIGHVNHRLRGRDSDRDEAFTRALANELGWPIFVARRPVDAGPGNLEEKARDLRYEALCGYAKRRRMDGVLTAHTQDDQAETVMLNLLRGCGPDGLSGMSAIRRHEASGVLIGRPLLTVGRAGVLSYLRESGSRFRLDKSNRDPRFARNYLRSTVFPSLDRRFPDFRRRVGRLADMVRDEQPAWEEWVSRAEKSALRPFRGGWLLDHRRFRRLSVGLQRRLLRRAAGRDLLTFDGVERLRRWMNELPTAGRVWQLRRGWVAERLSKSQGYPSPNLFWFHRVIGGRSGIRSTPKRKLKIG